MPTEQRLVLYQNLDIGTFRTKREDNLDEINAMLAQGWRVASISPTSSPTTDAGSYLSIFALVVLERDIR